MRKIPLVLSLIVALVWTLAHSGCRFAPPENDTQISEHGDDESHYNGRICADCHYTEGEGEGWFTMAGTTSGDYRLAVVELYTEENGQGEKLASAEVDGLGNFYTTEPIPNIKDGVWPLVLDGRGDSEEHPIAITTAQCNMCHGASEEPFSID